MWKTIALCLVAFLVAPVLACGAEFALVKQGDSVVDPVALTIEGGFGQCINGLSFQQEALLSHEGFQYVAYYDAARWVCVARRKLPAGEWQVLRLMDYKFESNDAHNVISMGICPGDGTIHLAFDHHGHPLHYRVSRKGVAREAEKTVWEASVFGPVQCELESGVPVPTVTYPRFWQTPEGGLQFCYRRDSSGNGDRMLVDYDPAQGNWKGTRQIDSRKGVFAVGGLKSASRCSYPNGYDYGPLGRLHMTWVWREGGGTANHDLMYAYSEDRGFTWKNNAGATLAEPAGLDSPGITVFPISPLLGLMNTHGQAVDSKGRIHAVVWHCTEASLKAAGSAPGEERWGPPEARRYHHYWRQTDGQWRHRELPGVAANRPKIVLDREDNAFVLFGGRRSGGSDLHDAGALHILAATSAGEWSDWHAAHVEAGPFLNEMLADVPRWKREGILSIMVQEPPEKAHDPTPLRVLDFAVAK